MLTDYETFAEQRIAVRRGDTFVGLDARYLAAVRPEWPVLVAADRRAGKAWRTPMSVRLADVIDVLDQAYPPRSVAVVDRGSGVATRRRWIQTVAWTRRAGGGGPGSQAGLLLVHQICCYCGSIMRPTRQQCWCTPDPDRSLVVYRAHTNADSASPVSDGAGTRCWSDRRRVLDLRPERLIPTVIPMCRARTQRRCGQRSLRPVPAIGDYR